MAQSTATTGAPAEVAPAEAGVPAEVDPPEVGVTADPDPTDRVDLTYTPSGTTVRVPPGVNLFEAASWNGIAIDSTCGGHGTCRKCRIQVTSGELPPSTPQDERTFSAEQLEQGWRLGCLAPATSPLTIEVPPLVTRPKASTVGVGRQVILRPGVQKRYLELVEPSLADQRPDLTRVLDALDDLVLTPDRHALRRLGPVLRRADYRVTAVIADDRLIDVEEGDTTGRAFGLAIDLGTTTVVATLMDTSTGTPAAVASMLNKQQPFGGDVISRISATMLDPATLPRLRQMAHETLAELAAEVCAEAGVAPHEVYEVAIAGNATMAALLLGHDPEPLGVAPFVLTTDRWPLLPAPEVGLADQVHPAARCFLYPALGAYVGGDIVAGIQASGMDRDSRIRLMIDIGTNCEIVLAHGQHLTCTAAPAGPAFEGGSIRCGMRAADGAIETVRLQPVVEPVGDAVGDPVAGAVGGPVVDAVADPVRLGVIGDVEPQGLCGSGLVDAVAELVRVGLLDASGRLVDDATAATVAPGLADRMMVHDTSGERVFVLYRRERGLPPSGCVYLSQRDVRELQFAKAAISTGWTLLLEEIGLTGAEVQQVLLAGSFGSYLSPASAVRIGLVPRLPTLRIVAAGNIAGEGAKMVLLSATERAGAEALLEGVRYVELSDRGDFNDRFVDQLSFPV